MLQGYNAQAVATGEQVIIAADITQQSNDSGQLEPMIDQAVTTLRGYLLTSVILLIVKAAQLGGG